MWLLDHRAGGGSLEEPLATMTDRSEDRPTFDSIAREGALVLGRYVVEAMLGYGAAGVVYQGRPQKTGALVAIKVQHAHNTVQRARFEREATLLRRINHPNVVGVVDYGVLGDGAAVVVMEFVDGVDAAEYARARGGWIPWRDAAQLGATLLDGLSAAHEAGVLHRDVKPDNVLIERGERLSVKLVDFGIARVSDDQLSQITVAGQILGSLAYMAPEQIAGDPIDARADLYAAGTLLYELVTGKRPFAGAGMRMGMAKLASLGPTEMPAPEGAEPWPKAFEDFVLRMLRSNPDERPADAASAKHALERVLRDARDRG